MSSSPKTILTVLWITLLTSQAVLIFVALKFIPNPGTSDFELIQYILPAIGVILLIISRTVYSKAAQNEVTFVDGQMSQNFAFYIVSWGLCEAVTIFGILFKLMAPADVHHVFHGFFIAGVGMTLLNRP